MREAAGVTGGESCDGGVNCSAGCAERCPLAPSLACRTPRARGNSVLALRSGDGPKSVFAWEWTRGDGTTKGDFGRPTRDDDYALCVYDARGLLAVAAAPAGTRCDRGAPCWSEQRHGFRYRGAHGSGALTRLVLRKDTGDATARITLRGGGPRLALPPPATLGAPLTVQLRNALGRCWSASFDVPTRARGALRLESIER